MEGRKAPYLPQDPNEIKQILQSMEASVRGKGKGYRAKKKSYILPDGKSKVESWQMNEWDYKKPHLPTYARGLFTQSYNGKAEIVARGYDKFFNINEVRKTEWRNIETNTRGPYELSVKENGCIIFISGLEDDTLLVTSKHSTGPRQDDSANHALAGEAWVEKQLAALGRTKTDLARMLRSMNATAVSELCDDDFEEHVLPYSPEQAGLYLHGINLNLPEFATYPSSLVADFADEWGFRRTMFLVKDTIGEVRPFLEQVAETGNYEGRDTEGFVIRCQARDSEDSPWHDWFFKFKFEEPYLMYRQWREATKAVIAGKPPRYKKHKKITDDYIIYARRQLAKNPRLAKEYNQNHGIIAMREGFLAEKGLKGSDIIRQEEEDGNLSQDVVTKNVVLVTVATIGCGKTTVSLALSKLFGWGHEQNDNIEGKNRPQKFALAVSNSLSANGVTIADRNNHQRRERTQIINDLRRVAPDVKIVALYWIHDRANYHAIRKTMQERIFSRGDNHQTIQANSKSSGEIQGIMEGFLQRFEPLNVEQPPDDAFDLVVDLDPGVSSRENLQTTINSLHEEYPKLFSVPTDEKLDQVIEEAMSGYRPDLRHDLGKGASKRREKDSKKQQNQQRSGNGNAQLSDKQPPMEYFLVSVSPADIDRILASMFNPTYNNDITPEVSKFYNQLKQTRRIQPEFHVTLMHRANQSQYPEYWSELCKEWYRCFEAQKEGQGAIAGSDCGVQMGRKQVQLDTLVWDGRLMAFAARLIDSDDQQPLPNGATGNVIWKSTNDVAHITVGTADEAIKPFESNKMLQWWMSDDIPAKSSIRDMRVKGKVILNGTVRGMVRR